MRRIRQVSPAAFKDWASKHGGYINDIGSFVSEQEWPQLIKCLLSDDEVVLSKFSSRVSDWRQFLFSWDTTRKLRMCSRENLRTGFSSVISPAEHPYPTNVFLMAIMFNAKRCCEFIKQSVPDLDLSRVNEYDFNAYHVLFLGMIIQSPHDTMEKKEQMEYFRYFLVDFFTSEQVSRMAHSVNCVGMRPLDWGVYRGYVHIVEKLLYLSHNLDSRAQVAGVMEHVQLDLSFSVSTEPSRYLSTLAIMSDLYGETNLANLKDTGLFRRPLLIGPWIDAIFRRNFWLLVIYFFERLIHCCLILGFFSSEVGDYLVGECATNADPKAKPPWGFHFTAVYSLFASAWQMGISTVCESRKHKYRRASGYPSYIRMHVMDALRWQIPYVSSAVLAVALLCIVGSPQSACAAMGPDTLRSLVGCLMLMFILASILSTLVLSRLFVAMSKFINSFYKSFAMFANFLVCYLLLLVIFTRLFQASGRFTWTVPQTGQAAAGNCNGSQLATDPRRLNFPEAFYQSFLLTLNVVDIGTFAPMSDRIDLLVTHFTFILLVPTLFINFVTGVLSSVVSDTMDSDVEALYLLKLNFAEYAETTYFWLYKIVERIRGRKSRLVISLCMPLHLGSRSMIDTKGTL